MAYPIPILLEGTSTSSMAPRTSKDFAVKRLIEVVAKKITRDWHNSMLSKIHESPTRAPGLQPALSGTVDGPVF
jgi:hypothetical protein